MTDDPAKTRLLPEGPAGELPIGATLSQGMYRVTGRIAAGGFGITYEARDNLDRKVAIKECFPAGLALRAGDFTVSAASASTAEPFETARTLFLREARMLATLRHSNVVHVQTLFEENGTAYMAMDFIEGRDLQHVLAHEPELLTPTYLMELTRALLAALDYLHRDAPERDKERLLHRDIKPANIRIDPLDTPVIIDFGAARQETKAHSRAAGTFRVVSDGYSPGEFYVAGAEQGPASDLYSLAATLYHCIAGTAPAPADARAQRVSNGETDPYAPLAGRFPAQDPRLLALIDRALARPLHERPADAAAWFAAIPDATTRIIASAAAPAAAIPAAAASNPGGFWKGAAITGGSMFALMGIGIYALPDAPPSDPALRQQLSDAQGAMATLEAELAQMSGMADGLQGDLDAALAARDAAEVEAEDLTATVTDLRAQVRAAEETGTAETAQLQDQLNEAIADQDAARAAQNALSAEVTELQAALDVARATLPEDTLAAMAALEAEREAARAAQVAADLSASRAQSDLQRMAQNLSEAESEANHLSMELRAARAEIELLTANATVPNNPGPNNPGPNNPGSNNPGPDNPGPDNPIPNNPTPTAACPTWATPGVELRYTGTDVYSPQVLTTPAGGAANLATCPGLPANVVGGAQRVPNYTLYLTEMDQFRRVEMQVTSPCDTTLLVNTNDTLWHFDDNSNGGVLPLLNLTGQAAIEGRIDIWIGTADGSSCDAMLELETWLN